MKRERKNKVKKVWKMTAALLLALLMLASAGCGGAPDTEGEPAESGGDEGPVASLKIGMAGKDIKTACIIVASRLGYYDEEGVDVAFEKISNLSEGLTAVDMGKLDVLPFGVIPSVTFVSQGSDVVVFGGTISEGSEIIGLPEAKGTVEKLEDFKGKKMGCYRMETGHMVMKGLLREAGYDPEKDMEFILLDSQQTIMEAVRKGDVDLGFLNSGQGYIAEQAGLSVLNTVAGFESDFPCCRQTTSRKALDEKREGLVRFQMANLRALETIRQDKEAALGALMEYSGQPREYVEAVIYGLDGVYDSAMVISLDPNKKKVVDFYEIMRANGDIDPATEYKMEDHVDATIYEDALKAMISREPENTLYTDLMEEFKTNNL